MEFLINPNVSYVLLILGFLIAILALFAPGTGFLEIAALFALLLAGYGIANVPVNAWAFAIMVVSFLPFGLAFRQQGRLRVVLLVGSVLLFSIGSTLLFPWTGWQPAVSPVLVLLLAVLSLGFAFLIGIKSVEAISARPSFDLDRLVGMTGQASSDIRGEGTVYVNGEEWSAHSRVFIPAGSAVRVLRREGLVLEVEATQA
jgi:membrane-bound serine protease (ClpP class)